LDQEITEKDICKEADLSKRSDSDGKVSKVELEFSVLIPMYIHPHFSTLYGDFLLTWCAAGFWGVMAPW
jgi:hypothetical protein